MRVHVTVLVECAYVGNKTANLIGIASIRRVRCSPAAPIKPSEP